jgi:dihydroneopterin aldolase
MTARGDEKHLRSEWTLTDLRIDARLGCLPSERKTPQTVRLDLRLWQDGVPAACRSDALADTVCYARLSAALRALGTEGEFGLIEHLAYRAFGVVRGLCPEDVRVSVTVTKLRPPVEGLEGGASFCVSELERPGADV